MARYAEMAGNQCVNVALADQATATARGWLGPVPTYVAPGWTTADNGQTWTSGTLPVPVDQQNQTTVREQLANALATLQTIIDSPDPAAGTLTSAQLSNAVRSLNTAVKALARHERRLIRLALADYTGSD